MIAAMIKILHLRRAAALVTPRPHINRLVDDRLFGLKDDNGQQLKAE